MKKETVYLLLFLVVVFFAISYVLKLIKENQAAINISKKSFEAAPL